MRQSDKNIDMVAIFNRIIAITVANANKGPYSYCGRIGERKIPSS